MTQLLVLCAVVFGLAGSAFAADTNFDADNKVAMDRMMAGMGVPSTGDADRDFATQMIAHHQGAIDMARLELRYGHNPQLRQLSRQIIVAQEKEIALMRAVLAKLPPVPAGSAPGAAPRDAGIAAMPGMQHR